MSFNTRRRNTFFTVFFTFHFFLLIANKHFAYCAGRMNVISFIDIKILSKNLSSEHFSFPFLFIAIPCLIKLKLFSKVINTLTANYEYSRSNRENLPLPIQIKLSKKLHFFCIFGIYIKFPMF